MVSRFIVKTAAHQINEREGEKAKEFVATGSGIYHGNLSDEAKEHNQSNLKGIREIIR